MASKWLTGYDTKQSTSGQIFDPLNLRSMFRGESPQRMVASETFAALTRQQWDDYLRFYVPVENELINYATNPQVLQDAVMNARTDVDNAFDAQAGVTERRLRGLGVSLAPDEQRAVDRSQGLARSLADVSAANLTTGRVRDRQQALLGSPAPQSTGGA